MNRKWKPSLLGVFLGNYLIDLFHKSLWHSILLILLHGDPYFMAYYPKLGSISSPIYRANNQGDLVTTHLFEWLLRYFDTLYATSDVLFLSSLCPCLILQPAKFSFCPFLFLWHSPSLPPSLCRCWILQCLMFHYFCPVLFSWESKGPTSPNATPPRNKALVRGF